MDGLRQGGVAELRKALLERPGKVAVLGARIGEPNHGAILDIVGFKK